MPVVMFENWDMPAWNGTQEFTGEGKSLDSLFFFTESHFNSAITQKAAEWTFIKHVN